MADISRAGAGCGGGLSEKEAKQMSVNARLMAFMQDKEVDGAIEFDPFELISITFVNGGWTSRILYAYAQFSDRRIQITETEVREALTILYWQKFKKECFLDEEAWPKEIGPFNLDGSISWMYVFNPEIRKELQAKTSFNKKLDVESAWEYLLTLKGILLENAEYLAK